MTSLVNTSFLGSQKIFPEDEGKETMIKVDHVSMTFNMASENLNNLKEYAIALARRELRFKEFKALNDVSLEVKKGDVYGILGTNGSGKSTLLKIIAGVLDPSSGTCVVNGSIAPLIELGAGFDMELTARENIYLNGALLGYSRQFIWEHFEEIVEFAEIEQFLDMPLKNYSSGMVARIAFAIATVIIPDILIVDEVLSVGDFMFQKKCEQRIASLINDYQVTVLIVSHDNNLVRRLCNKAIWIEKGNVRTVGPAEEVCDIYRVLGGHTGSSCSEKTILRILENNLDSTQVLSETLAGEGSHGTLARMVQECDFSKGGFVFVYAGEPHLHCLILNSLAGALNGPILLSRENRLFDVSAQVIKSLKPSEIVVVSDSDASKEELISDIEAVCGEECNIHFLSAGSLISFSKEIYGLGKSFGCKWNSTAVVMGSDDLEALITISPLCYEKHMPLFIVEKREQATLEKESFLKAIVSKKSVLSEITNNNLQQIELLFPAVDDSSSLRPNTMINNWICSHQNSLDIFEPSEYVVCKGVESFDSYVLGPFAGKRNALVLIDDPTDLDSVAAAVTYLENRRDSVKKLTFLGSELCYCNLDKMLLEKSISYK